MRDGSAEERNDRVADELLDRAAEALKLEAQPLPVGCEQGAYILRIELLGTRRETDEVCEQHSDDLAFLAWRCWCCQRRPAHSTQQEAIGVFLAAARTEHRPQPRLLRRATLVTQESSCGHPA